MEKIKYELADQEIQTLISGLKILGKSESYQKMRERLLIAKNAGLEAHEIGMDLCEFLLNKAREDVEEKNKKDLYELSLMFRSLAHEMKKYYVGQPNSGRFLEIINCATSA